MNHPAKFSEPVLTQIRLRLEERLPHTARILDPFAGTGRVHQLGYESVGVEIEAEWAACHDQTVCGDSTQLVELLDGGPFDAIVTSPAYGNRMADNYAGDKHNTRRFTYRTALGRPLSDNNGARLQWGQQYRDFHRKVWEQCAAVLQPGGAFLLNVSNHIRAGAEQPVVEFHIAALVEHGFFIDAVDEIETARVGFGANSGLRVGTEKLIVARSDKGVAVDM